MNAGANNHETCETLISVDFICENGNLHTLLKDELEFSYRTSPFQTRKGVIAGATFKLNSCGESRKRQLDIINYRKQTQPYSDKSAGCVFKNPTCKSAGALIEVCGLKGASIGGAEVSTLHANFLVNKQGATAQDVLNLIDHVRLKVKDQTGIELESEIRFVPYESEFGKNQ